MAPRGDRGGAGPGRAVDPGPAQRGQGAELRQRLGVRECRDNTLISVRTIPPQDGGYDDGSCDTEQQCSLCRFGLHPRAALRGVCAAARWGVTY